jgi:hypothetical protein
VTTFERWFIRAATTVASALLMLTMASVAWAQDDVKTIAVHIEGAKAATYRDRVIQVVPEGLEVVSEGKFRQSLARGGLRGGMGYAVTSAKQRPMLFRVIRKAIKNAKVEGAIVGRVRASKKGGLEMVVVYIDESDSLGLDEVVSLKGSEEEQIANLAEVLVPVLGELAPAPEPEPTPEPEPDDEGPSDELGDDDEEDDDDDDGGDSEFEPNRPGSELFSVGVGVEFGGRFFDYNDVPDGFDNLRPYDVFGVPGLLLTGEIYPAATLDITVLSDIGLAVSFMQAFGLSSQTDDEALQFSNTYNRFTGGLRYRFRIGDKDDNPIVLGAAGDFGFLNFTFEPDNEASVTNADEVGTVKYLFLRGGLDARIPLVDWFALTPRFAYIGPLSGGDAYDRVNGSSVGGLDLELMLAFMVGAGFEVRTGLEYIRYFASFDPQVGDTFVAGGALDQYVLLRAGAAYVF